MILVQDNYLSEEDFEWLQDHCDTAKFEYINGGDNQFLAIETPQRIVDEMEIDGYDIIFTFIRKAHKDFDTDPRIHSDGIIMNRYTDMAGVLYINKEGGVSANGTKFYKHHKHGIKLPEGVSPEVYDQALMDSNDLSKFEETDKVSARPNRYLMYDASYFHAKYPNKIEEGERIVLVVFYEENGR